MNFESRRPAGVSRGKMFALNLQAQRTSLRRFTTALFLITSFLVSNTVVLADPADDRHEDKSHPLVEFTSPAPATAVSTDGVKVKLRLGGKADASTLKISANGHDITSSFYRGYCGIGPCRISGVLQQGSELKPGWNYLLASVNTESGASSSTRLRFYNKIGVTDPTNGIGAPYAVHVAMSPTAGLEVDYTPEGGNAPYFYPGAHPCDVPGNLTVIDLNRSTLEWKATTCYGAGDDATLQTYLATLNENDLVLASTGPGIALGKLNLALIGGTNFNSQGPQRAPAAAYSYSIIGYGKGSAGIGTESYNTDAITPWHGLDGNLINVSNDDQSLFGFQSTDSQGFAIVPNGTTATIVVGNPKTFPTGTNGTPPNQVIPAGFNSATYTAPPLSGTGGGLWVLVLDRYTLNFVSSTTYSSRLENNSINSSQTMDLFNQINSLDNNKVVFMTTLIGPDTSGDYGANALNTQVNSQDQYSNTLGHVIKMGVSPYAFDKPMNAQRSLGYPASEFSMIGIPNNFLADAPSNANGPTDMAFCRVLLPNNSALTCGPNQNQWFSSALDKQQNETGALTGSFTRNKAFQYTPTNVRPFDAGSLGDSPGADALLADNLSHAIGTAPSVAWPLTDTAGHKNAYAYISNQLTSLDFYGGGVCAAEASICSDIRFYYTGSEAARVADGTAPTSLPYPGDAIASKSGFTSQDWNDSTAQLGYEKGYLGNVLAYQAVVQGMNTDSTENIGAVLTAAATRVANDINQATGQPSPVVNVSPISLSVDALSTASGIAGAISVAFPPVGVVSGILAAAGGILSIFKDAQKTTTQPDPYVNQLGDLLSDNSGRAAQAAVNFNSDVEKSTATFFNGIYSDWFKLQTIAYMTVNPDAPAWYSKDGGSTASLAPLFLANARKGFYLQTGSLYFDTIYITNVAAYIPGDPQDSLIPTFYKDTPTLANALATHNGFPHGVGLYNYWNRDVQPWVNTDNDDDADGNWDFNFVLLKSNQNKPWSDEFGTTLMGPPSSDDGLGNLNLNRDMLYDSGVFPTVKSINNN